MITRGLGSVVTGSFAVPWPTAKQPNGWFHSIFKITLENRSDDLQVIFYEITYVFRKMPQNIGYFHAAFNRVNPLPYKEVYTIIDHIEGHGQYVGTVMNWGSNNAGWWGEGEIKFFMDGDRDYPTICGTGTEDYFCGSFAFMRNEDGYIPFATPYSGMPLVIRPDGRYSSQTRFGLYRWHITDPVYFKENLTVTMQALGWRSGGRYLPLQDDISSVAFWYQDQPSLIRRPVGDRDALEII